MSYRQMIDQYVRRFGASVGVRFDPLSSAGHTYLRRGSATVGINVLESEGVIVFLSPMLEVPPRRREALFRRLLELNFLLTADAAFAIEKESNLIYLRLLRGLEGLDYGEFVDMLDTIARVADDWDDRLRAEFGA